MTAHVDPKHLAGALSKILAVVERRTTVPVLSHVLIVVRGDTMQLRGSDGDIEISIAIPCEGELEPICAPAEPLHAAATRFAERGMAGIAHDSKALNVAAGRGRVSMPVLPADDMPSLSVETGSAFTIAGKQLAMLFKACAPAMSSEETRIYLKGVHLERGALSDPKADRLLAAATDGHKLSVRDIAADLPADFPSVIVPAKTVNVLAKLAEDWEEVGVELTRNRIIAHSDVTRVVSKLVEGTFPDWRRVVPPVKPFVSYDSGQLRDAIAMTMAIVKNAEKVPALRLTFGDDETEMFARSNETSSSGEDACPHSLITDRPVEAMGVAHNYLLDMIAALGAETIEIACGGTNEPIVLSGAALSDRKAVVMPIRIAHVPGDPS